MNMTLSGKTALITGASKGLGKALGVASAGADLVLGLAPDQITVNGIRSGRFATEMNKPLLENTAMSREFLAKIPLGRWGQPVEVGRLAVYLCSEAADFITRADFVIDGGSTAQ